MWGWGAVVVKESALGADAKWEVYLVLVHVLEIGLRSNLGFSRITVQTDKLLVSHCELQFSLLSKGNNSGLHSFSYCRLSENLGHTCIKSAKKT